MTYQTRVTDDGRLEVPSDMLAAIGLTPGDLVTIEHDGRKLVLEGGDVAEPLMRLRAAMRGYTVDKFIANRRADWGE